MVLLEPSENRDQGGGGGEQGSLEKQCMGSKEAGRGCPGFSLPSLLLSSIAQTCQEAGEQGTQGMLFAGSAWDGPRKVGSGEPLQQPFWNGPHFCLQSTVTNLHSCYKTPSPECS